MSKQIAASRGLNERTAKLHRMSLTMKVGAPSAARLAALASEARHFESCDVRGAHT
jgi:DNA-binding CsgD family transcriptional regulator